MEGNLPFFHCFTLYLREISKHKSPGGLYSEGRFNGGFFALRVLGAYIWRGLFSEFYGMFIIQTLCTVMRLFKGSHVSVAAAASRYLLPNIIGDELLLNFGAKFQG